MEKAFFVLAIWFVVLTSMLCFIENEKLDVEKKILTEIRFYQESENEISDLQ